MDQPAVKAAKRINAKHRKGAGLIQQQLNKIYRETGIEIIYNSNQSNNRKDTFVGCLYNKYGALYVQLNEYLPKHRKKEQGIYDEDLEKLIHGIEEKKLKHLND